MGSLAPLLEVQALDRECDRLRAQRAGLPERSDQAANDARLAALDAERTSAVRERDALEAAEDSAGEEVAALARKAKEVEDKLYSGTVTVARELATVGEELASWKHKQAEAEERELELLERIEDAEAELAALAARRGELEAAGARIAAAIAAAEARIDGEIAGLAETAERLRSALPADVLAHYDALRERPRLGGEAVSTLRDGACAACRMKLPVLEHTNIQKAPADAVVVCPHCKRILVR